MTTGSEHVDEDAVELRLTPWAHSGEAKLYVRAEHETQLRELLTASGITSSRVYEFHYEPILVAVLISVGNPAAWKALATAVTAFLERNKNKTVQTTLAGETVELGGYSASEVERLIEKMAQLHQEEEKNWRRIAGPDHPTGEVEHKP